MRDLLRLLGIWLILMLLGVAQLLLAGCQPRSAVNVNVRPAPRRPAPAAPRVRPFIPVPVPVRPWWRPYHPRAPYPCPPWRP